MKESLFERQHHTTKDLATGKRTPHKSVNEAKRWSRKKQIALDGGLGHGSVRVVA